MSPLHALFTVAGLLAAVAVTFYGTTAVTRGHDVALRYTAWLLVGFAVGVGGTFALAWVGGAFS